MQSTENTFKQTPKDESPGRRDRHPHVQAFWIHIPCLPPYIHFMAKCGEAKPQTVSRFRELQFSKTIKNVVTSGCFQQVRTARKYVTPKWSSRNYVTPNSHVFGLPRIIAATEPLDDPDGYRCWEIQEASRVIST